MTLRPRDKILYWGSTGLFSALMLASAGMYIVNTESVAETFTALGYPTYLITPLAIAKILGVVAILSDRVRLLRELAYAGFFYDIVLAFFAHIQAADGEFAPAIVALVLVTVSYAFATKVRRPS